MALQKKLDAWRGQIRMPMPLALWVQEQGQRNFRSMNAELVEMVRRFREEAEAKKEARA
ncbi:Arc domain-containing protein [Aromatoleum anaerobium]|uniref:Arc domain-containing protein n=1 Tax=Aromatoleum anaerobium TaxID=182180 RepID=A0ABX1PRP3_9RHOO|nr:Arc domain-containing protein [Aromatoleum anaerobium]MCK0507888.1 hypothetical protein [Aromatoleum anaerobium]